jgi:integrase/recombinase XerC
MGEKGMDPRAATRDDLIDYIDSIKHYKVTSQRRLVTVARLFYRELEVRAMLPGPNPTLMLPKIRGKADEQPAGFSEKEAASLLSEIDAKIKSDNLVEHFLAVRDYAIVYLALTSGLRESELVGLKCADIHQERSIYWVVQVHGKGRKDRIVKIRDRAVEVINAYKEQMATLGVILGDDDPLFIRIGPKAEPDGAVPMGTRNLRKLVGKWLEVATLNGPRKGPHQLRRTAATIAYENGAPVDVVSDMLGHADLRTTRDNYIKPVDRLKHSASDHIHL